MRVLDMIFRNAPVKVRTAAPASSKPVPSVRRPPATPGTLSDPERQMLTSFVAGLAFGTNEAASGTPSEEDWPVVRAEVIALALFGVEIRGVGTLKMGHRGVHLTNVIIDGLLDLTGLQFRLPIRFEKCRFNSGLVLAHSDLGLVSLRESTLQLLHAPCATIHGDLDVQKCTILHSDASDQIIESHPTFLEEEHLALVDTSGAMITGVLDLSNAIVQLKTPSERQGAGNRFSYSILADRTQVGGSAFFRGLRTRGECSLIGSRIVGQLAFEGATLEGDDLRPAYLDALRKLAEELESAKDQGMSQSDAKAVATAFREYEPLIAELELRGTALECEGCTIGRKVVLRNRFTAKGKISFARASIGAQLEVTRAKLENFGDDALDMTAATTGGANLGPLLTCGGSINFQQSHMKGDLVLSSCFVASVVEMMRPILKKAQEAARKLTNRSARNRARRLFQQINQASPNRAIDLRGCAVDGTLDLRELSGARIKGLLDLRDTSARFFADTKASWPAKGNLLLDGFLYQGFLSSHFETTPLDFEADNAVPMSIGDRLDWLLRQPKIDITSEFKPQPFSHLARVLRSAGDDAAADEVLFHREARLAQRSGVPGFFYRIFFGLAAGYGYRWTYSLAWLAIFCAISVVIFAAAEHRGLIKATNANDDTKFDAFAYAADVIVPQLDTLPIAEVNQQQRWQVTSASTAGRPLQPLTFHGWANHQLLAPIARCIERALDDGWARWWEGIATYIGWYLTIAALAGMTGFLQKRE